jgi:hypothetical protein
MHARWRVATPAKLLVNACASHELESSLDYISKASERSVQFEGTFVSNRACAVAGAGITRQPDHRRCFLHPTI